MKNQVEFSRIIAGTMTWGSWGKQLDKKGMADLMNHCVDTGISSFDHADIYGGYGNEEAFGDAFATSGLQRDTIQLITKCGIQYVTEARNNRVKHYDYSRDYIIWSAEQSLRKLRTDYLDLFLLHRPSPLMDPGIIAEAATTLHKSGKIRSFGVSNFTPSQIEMLEKEVAISANQVEFSLTAPGVMFDGTLDDIITHDRLAMSWSPLGSYFREKNGKRKRIKKVIKKLKSKYGLNNSQLLLSWILKHPAKVHPVVGTTDPKRLQESLEAVNTGLDLEDWFLLLTASQGHKVP